MSADLNADSASKVIPDGAWVIYRHRGKWEFAQVDPDGREVGREPPPGTEVHRCVWKSGELISHGLATVAQVQAVHAVYAAERDRVSALPEMQNPANWGPRPW